MNCQSKATSVPWTSCLLQKPDEGKVVMTCIMDRNGMRNEQLLVRKKNLWFHSDMSMYVYYEPSHWKEVK